MRIPYLVTAAGQGLRQDLEPLARARGFPVSRDGMTPELWVFRQYSNRARKFRALLFILPEPL